MRRGRGREAVGCPRPAPRRPPSRLNGRSALSTGPLVRMAAGTLAMAQAEMRKLRHDHLDIITRSVQPLLWLFIFGTALSRTALLSIGKLEYRAYIAPGVMAQAAMFIAIFYGLSVIWERDVGQLQRLLATPLSRSSIVLGKAAGACVRALVQALLLLVGARHRGHRGALERPRSARHARDADARNGRIRLHVDAAGRRRSRSASASWASAS